MDYTPSRLICQFYLPHLYYFYVGILDILFPKYCLLCKRFGAYICPSCQKSLSPLLYQRCPECERQSFNGKTHPRCVSRYSLDGLWSVYEYTGSIKTCIRRFKYKPFLSDLATFFAQQMQVYLPHTEGILVPVPLHPIREQFRGFNQSYELASSLAKQKKQMRVLNMLKRIKHTSTQTHYSAQKRKENIKNAFAVSEDFPYQIPIYLIDDVWTTGATIQECCRVLKKAGAKRVYGITIAQ